MVEIQFCDDLVRSFTFLVEGMSLVRVSTAQHKRVAKPLLHLVKHKN